LAHLPLFSILAVLAGAISYRGIRVFMDVHRERFNAVFGVRWHRAPDHWLLREITAHPEGDGLDRDDGGARHRTCSAETRASG
jgi:hypothetical protein